MKYNVDVNQNKDKRDHWRSFYPVAGVATLLTVIVGIIETVLTSFPGGTSEDLVTVVDWFEFYTVNPFMGLRNMGLLNIALTMLGLITVMGLYVVLRHDKPVGTTVAAVFYYVGAAVFFATNRALPMLALSNQYNSATGEAQRIILESAGQTMLAVGQSHTPGTFLAITLIDIGMVMLAVMMLSNQQFGALSAAIGLMGFSLLIVFEILSSFVPAAAGIELTVSTIGGLMSIVWYVMVGLRLINLGRA